MSKETLWPQVMADLSQQVSDSQLKLFQSYIRQIQVDEQELVIEALNDFSRQMMQTRFLRLVQEALQRQGSTLVPRLTVRGGGTGAPAQPLQPSLPGNEATANSQAVAGQGKTASGRFDGQLNAKYTFETFVVGKSNEFAHAVCRAVAEKPGEKYNPVFIYGGVGLGKTHLMQAIGHEVLRLNPKARVACLSSEAFTNEFINALRDKSPDAFRKRYRHKDLLLIDDIQFLAGKESVVEEFFHTFNQLFQGKKQIVLTSDAPPKKIPKLEDRLVSRFEMGVVADIQPPDVTLRAAILKRTAAHAGVSIADEVVMYLAELVTNNVRELEGAFTRLIAYASVTGKNVDRELVERVLKDIVHEGGTGRITIPWIQKQVAEFYSLPLSDMTSDRRSQAVTGPRQVAMYLARNLLGETYPRIGEAFGGKDHSTVMHAERKVAGKLNTDPTFKAELERLQRLLKPQRG